MNYISMFMERYSLLEYDEFEVIVNKDSKYTYRIIIDEHNRFIFQTYDRYWYEPSLVQAMAILSGRYKIKVK